jgi:glucose-6-phosphate isomerase
VFHARHWAAGRFSLLAAAGVYAMALVFRTLDQEVCPALPIGTHFLWHSLIRLGAHLAVCCLILSRSSRFGLGGESGFQRA